MKGDQSDQGEESNGYDEGDQDDQGDEGNQGNLGGRLTRVMRATRVTRLRGEQGCSRVEQGAMKCDRVLGNLKKRFSGIRPLRGYPPPTPFNGKSV